MRFGDRWLSRIEQAWSPAITHTDSTTVSAHALGDLGREATGSHRSPARGRDPDERLALVGHSLLVLVPVRMFAGDRTEVVHERLSGFRHVEHLGRAVHLYPGPVEVVGEHADAHLGVAPGVTRLRPPRVRRHHYAALLVHAAAHRGKLWPPVTARGHVDPLVPGTQEVKELVAGDGVDGGDLGHARDTNASAAPDPRRTARSHSRRTRPLGLRWGTRVGTLA